MYVSSKVSVGDGYNEEFGVGMADNQGSVLSSLFFIIVLVALSSESRRGRP